MRTTVSNLKGKTIAFAASGGLDSCTITRWLTEAGVNVVCITADMAQPDEADFDSVRQRMLACGAKELIVVPLHDAIAEAGLDIIQAQAYYEGRYWNTTGIGRHVIVAGMLPEMKKRGISILSHGSTGRGNDQVRFQLVTNMLEPTFEVYAPWRDEAFLAKFRGRSEMIDYCSERKLPIKATKDAPYSTDANLLGLTHEAGKLESLETPPSFVTPGMGVLADEGARQAGDGDDPLREGPARRDQRQEGQRLPGDHSSQSARRQARRRHLLSPRRKSLRRHQEPRRLRSPRHGAARHRLCVSSCNWCSTAAAASCSINCR